MTKKMQGQNTTLWWMTTAATAAADLPGALSLAKITTDIAATNFINLTPAVVSGYTLNPTDSDTDDTAAVSDTGNAKARGLYNYEAKFQFFREADTVANTTSIYTVALGLFKVRGAQGYWVRRIGYPQGTALAVGHKLEVFKVESFSPKTLDSDKGKPIFVEINFGQQAFMKPPTAIVA